MNSQSFKALKLRIAVFERGVKFVEGNRNGDALPEGGPLVHVRGAGIGSRNSVPLLR